MTDALQYLTGFGGYFESEAVTGALPKGRNSPQRPAFGLYTEQLSGSSFTSPRHENRRSWLYRMRPTADHRPFGRYDGAPLFAPGTVKEPLAPNRLRWDPPNDLPEGKDFADGMVTMLANRDPADLEGVAVHLYRASKSMEQRVFVDADGELLIIPQQGTLRVLTEFGRMDVPPGTVAVVPRLRLHPPRGEPRVGAEHLPQPRHRLPPHGPVARRGVDVHPLGRIPRGVAHLRAAEREPDLERQRRLPLVRDDDEQIGVPPRPQHELERLHRLAAGHPSVERRPAAGEEEPRAGRKAPVPRQLREPLGLRRDRAPCVFAEHKREVYTIEARWRSSNATCSTTACAC